MRRFALAILLLSSTVALGEPRVCESYYEEIYQSPARDKLKAIVKPDQLAARDPEAHKKIFRLAEEMLAETNTPYELIQLYGQPALKILPGVDGRFARLAKRIDDAYGAELLFAPGQAAKMNADGMAVTRRAKGGKKKIGLLMSAGVFSGANRPLRDPTIVHEIRHLKYKADRIKGRSSIYDGHAMATVGHFPGMKADLPYAEYMSFEELKTHQHSVFSKAALLSRNLRLDQPDFVTNYNIHYVNQAIDQWEAVLGQSRRLLQEANAYWKKHPNDLNESINQKRLQAWLEFSAGESTIELVFEHPIKAGQKIDSVKFFRQRSAELLRATDFYAAQATRAKALMEKLASASVEERGQIAREILTALPRYSTR